MRRLSARRRDRPRARAAAVAGTRASGGGAATRAAARPRRPRSRQAPVRVLRPRRGGDHRRAHPRLPRLDDASPGVASARADDRPDDLMALGASGRSADGSQGDRPGGRARAPVGRASLDRAGVGWERASRNAGAVRRPSWRSVRRDHRERRARVGTGVRGLAERRRAAAHRAEPRVGRGRPAVGGSRRADGPDRPCRDRRFRRRGRGRDRRVAVPRGAPGRDDGGAEPAVRARPAGPIRRRRSVRGRVLGAARRARRPAGRGRGADEPVDVLLERRARRRTHDRAIAERTARRPRLGASARRACGRPRPIGSSAPRRKRSRVRSTGSAPRERRC
jgi:hypothetical protein